MKYGRAAQQDPGDPSAARDPDLARRARQAPGKRLGIFLLLGLVAATALLSPNAPTASAAPAAAVSAGQYHTCALTTSGGVKCWGYNGSGQLGDGTTVNRSTPVDVLGLSSGVAVLSAGLGHTCALTTGGGVKCWGSNGWGELGDGKVCGSFCTSPVDVSGLGSGVAAVSAGANHTCARTTGGGVKCWGSNPNGELGDGGVCGSFCTSPVDVSGLTSGVAAIAAGYLHTCAVTNAGGVKCWGYNEHGHLGDGTTTTRRTPTDVVGLSSGVAAVAAGTWHTCALTTGGGVKCWGSNTYGQVGEETGSGDDWLTPVDVVGLTSGVAAVSAGWLHTCARITGGGVKCWGYNSWGELGDGSTTWRYSPVDVVGLSSGVATVSAGWTHTCAVTTAGGVKCWGYNGWGGLGDGTAEDRHAPADVLLDIDDDGELDPTDNCPGTANPGQQNLDGDALGDACDPDSDNDGVNNPDETACGSDAMDITPPLSRPERVDGAFAGLDDDGDTQVDEALPAGAASFDCDGDGYKGAAEAAIYSPSTQRDQDPCGTDAWPSDFVSGGIFGSTNRVLIDDLNTFLSPRKLDLDLSGPGDPIKRWDLSPGKGIFSTDINIADLNALLGGATAYPPMLGGERALGGPTCPWPP